MGEPSRLLWTGSSKSYFKTQGQGWIWKRLTSGLQLLQATCSLIQWVRRLHHSCAGQETLVWAAHMELSGRCLCSPALLLVRSEVTPSRTTGEVQSCKDRQNIWCWQLMPLEGCCLLCCDGFMASPSGGKKKPNQHWKVLLGLSFHKSRVTKSPFLYTGGK